MFTLTAEAHVNTDPAQPALTAAEVFTAMKRRARAASDTEPELVPPNHRFDIIEDHQDRLVRRVTREDGTQSLVRVSFHGDCLVVADFFEGPQRGVMTQLVSTDDKGELIVVFTSVTEIPGMEHGSSAERELVASRRQFFSAGPAQTIAYARLLSHAGRP